MRTVLFVDDDPVITRVYKNALASRGLIVETANDGIAALRLMHEKPPDVVVLDLMMPRLSGPDVLKLMQQQPELATVPVIVLSNSYLDSLTNEAVAAGARTGLLKTTCSPVILIEAISEVLDGKESAQADASLMTVTEKQRGPQPQPQTKSTKRPLPPVAPTPPRAAIVTQRQPPETPAPSAEPLTDSELRAQMRSYFLEAAVATCSGLRTAFQNFSAVAPGDQRNLRLQDLYRRVHFLSASAGLSECWRLAQMANAFEALLFRLMDDPTKISSSAMRTIAATVDYVQTLFEEAQEGKLGINAEGSVIVIDDDPVSNRLVVWALTQAGVVANSSEDPIRGLKLLQQKQYDLILLDVQMAVMDGFEFCRRARRLPAYAKTPVIYVTVHSDFDTRAQSVLAGGNDLISKPVLPMELSVKVVMHLLKNSTQP